VLDSLEKNVREINNVVIPEVKKAIGQWKDRSAFSSLIVLGFIATLAIFAEIQFGILELLIDPIIGPIVIVALLIIMIPLHILFSRLQAKLTISQLNARQKELHLMENLAGNFEKNLTFSRMLLPISEPVGWNKKTKLRLSQISSKTKELVQLLNDNFSTYDGQPSASFSDSPDFK
jgi:parvulin-like peptidyl-prolyl isomerase